jgi:predicted NUDIX family NTP pyrophosphohydrolase
MEGSHGRDPARVYQCAPPSKAAEQARRRASSPGVGRRKAAAVPPAVDGAPGDVGTSWGVASRTAAGLLMYRLRAAGVEVLLVHPGGPLWARRDIGAWSIPKGEPEPGEELLGTARREFQEETGLAPEGPFRPLGTVRQRGGKEVAAWCFPGDLDPSEVRSQTFSMEWPPRSGRRADFPEVDRAAWFSLDAARERILPGQVPLLEELERVLALPGSRARATPRDPPQRPGDS